MGSYHIRLEPNCFFFAFTVTMATETLAINIMVDGRRRGIWEKGFAPPGIKVTFMQYLKEKLKELKRRERVKMLQQKIDS